MSSPHTATVIEGKIQLTLLNSFMSSVYFARASAARRMNGSFSAALSVLHCWLPSRDTRANSSPCEGYSATAERRFSGEEIYGHCTRQHAPPDAPRQSAPCLLRVDEVKEEAEKIR